MLKGTGLTITFDTGFFAEILDVSGPGASRESLKTTHMGTTTAHTFTPANLVDWGEMGVEMAFAPGTRPPIDAAAENCTVTYSDGSTVVGEAFMTGFEPGAPLEEMMTADATLKFSGDLEFTAGS